MKTALSAALLCMLGSIPIAAATASAQTVAAPAATLGSQDAARLVKSALRTQFRIARGYTRSCARRTRLRFRCKARWVDEFDNRLSATVEIWRTGSSLDDREHFSMRVRSGTTVRSYAGPFIEETRRASLGESRDLIGNDGDLLRVTAGALIDPVATDDFDAPPAGTRYVGVPLSIMNLGTGRYEDSLSNGARLVTRSGQTIRAAIVVTGPCNEQRVDIPTGETRLACVAFAVGPDVQLRAFEFSPNSGYAPETGEWALPE